MLASRRGPSQEYRQSEWMDDDGARVSARARFSKPVSLDPGGDDLGRAGEQRQRQGRHNGRSLAAVTQGRIGHQTAHCHIGGAHRRRTGWAVGRLRELVGDDERPGDVAGEREQPYDGTRDQGI